MNNTENKKQQRNKNEKRVYVDFEIFSGNVKLISQDGKAEIIDRDDAIALAKENGMNLVQISYCKNEHPHSICKIMNYGKFKFEQKKKEKERARRDREANAEAKELIFSIRIDENDKNTKISHAREFLLDGNRVKISVKLSKREMHLVDMAKEQIRGILTTLEDIAELDGAPSFNNRILSCGLRPKRR